MGGELPWKGSCSNLSPGAWQRETAPLLGVGLLRLKGGRWESRILRRSACFLAPEAEDSGVCSRGCRVSGSHLGTRPRPGWANAPAPPSPCPWGAAGGQAMTGKWPHQRVQRGPGSKAEPAGGSGVRWWLFLRVSGAALVAYSWRYAAAHPPYTQRPHRPCRCTTGQARQKPGAVTGCEGQRERMPDVAREQSKGKNTPVQAVHVETASTSACSQPKLRGCVGPNCSCILSHWSKNPSSERGKNT